MSVAIGAKSYVRVLASNFMRRGSEDFECSTEVTVMGWPLSSLILGSTNLEGLNHSMLTVESGAEVK